MLRTTGWTLLVTLAGLTFTTSSAGAGMTPAIDAQVLLGADTDMTGIGRLYGGGTLVFDELRLGIDAHLAFSAFLRIDDAKGVEARSFDPINVGVRYGFRNARFHGPYVTAGLGYGFFSGKPHERKVEDTATCATAQDPSRCTFDITQQVNGRVGFGWGFASGAKTTVGVRLDVTYFAFSVADGEDQPDGAPNPNFIPRVQGTWAVMLGLEFLRWP